MTFSIDLMTILKRRNVNFITSRQNLRQFTATTKDLFDVLEEKVEEEIGYDQWLASTKESLKNSKGPYWLGKSSPFPYNSAFTPKPVLSDASKTRIIELFKQNPKANDHRTLAQQFRISMDRVQAIIRQKELEIKLAGQGNVVSKEFISSIESNLGSVDTLNENIETEMQQTKLPFRPLFACVPEGRGFNFQDAKNVLMSEGIKVKVPSDKDKNYNISSISSISSIASIASNDNVGNEQQIISHSKFERSRSKFIFVNLKKIKRSKESKNEKITFISKDQEDKNDILVRDCDGTLRAATSVERELASIKTWNRNRPSCKN